MKPHWAFALLLAVVGTGCATANREDRLAGETLTEEEQDFAYDLAIEFAKCAEVYEITSQDATATPEQAAHMHGLANGASAAALAVALAAGVRPELAVQFVEERRKVWRNIFILNPDDFTVQLFSFCLPNNELQAELAEDLTRRVYRAGAPR